MACKSKDKFITSEAATKAALRTQGIIDEFLNIKQLHKFREKVRQWSNDAKQRFGIQERLFTEDGLKTVPNKIAFKQIDNAKGIFYQLDSESLETNPNFEIIGEGFNYESGEGFTLNLRFKGELDDNLPLKNRQDIVEKNFKYLKKLRDDEIVEINNINAKLDSNGNLDLGNGRTAYIKRLGLHSSEEYKKYLLNEINTNRNDSKLLVQAERNTHQYENSDEITTVYLNDDGSISGSLGSVGIEISSQIQGKGFGKDAYRTIGDYLVNNKGLKLKSDGLGHSESAHRVWESLRKLGEAKIIKGNTNDFNNNFYTAQYEYIGSNKQFQLSNIPISKSSPETLSKIKEIAKKMGINIQTLADYIKGNPNVDVKGINGLADLVKGVIAISEGQESVTLTEEVVHIATAMLEQTHPELITEMISKIGRFQIYQKTLEVYKNNKDYQLSNGKPNIRKIKKETVDKLITELIINQSEGSTEFPELQNEIDRSMIRNWWTKILDIIRGMYKKANIDIFNLAGEKIIDRNTEIFYARKKEGVDFVFEQNSELINIGTQEQYSKYLETVFPNSKIKDILRHGTNYDFKEFDLNFFGKTDIGESGRGIYFSSDLISSKEENTPYTINKYVLINSINPYFEKGREDLKYFGREEKIDEKYKKLYPNTISNDATITYNKGLELEHTEIKDIVVRNTSQIHILGSQQDIEGFKKYMKSAPKEFKGEGVFYQLSKPQEDIQKKLMDTAFILKKVESKESVDPIFMDTEEASNWYELLVDGVWVKDAVKKRVTDRVKAWYKQKFPNKNFTPEEKKFNEFKRKYGVMGHGFFEEIHGRYYNPDGTKKLVIGERSIKLTNVDEQVYNKLENYFTELVAKFSENNKSPLVFSEVKVYDPKQKEAGTLDLLIIEESGKANIFDWKFMSVSDKAKDIAWFKQGAFNIQLGRYKEILQKVYGIKEIGMNRAIPILMEFREDVKTKDSILKGIVVGSVDSSKISDLRLIPVSETTESTGEEALDDLIKQLNAMYKQLSKRTVTNDEEREFKSVRLNTIKEAVRKAQGGENLTALIDVLKQTRLDGDYILNDYKTIYEGNPTGEFTEKQLSDFAEEMREYIAISEVFGNIPDQIGSLIYNTQMEKDTTTDEGKEEMANRKITLQNIEQEAKLIRASRKEIDKSSGKFVDRFIGIRNLVSGLLDPKTVVKGLSSTFRGVSELPLPSLQILFKLVENAKAKASQTALVEVNELLEIKKALDKRGGDLRKLVQQIYQRDDNNTLVNKLIYKYQKEFFTGIDENAKEGEQDIKWLKDNIDVDAYKIEVNKHLEEKITQIKRKYNEDGETLEKLIKEEKEKWDVDNKNFNGWNNYIIKRHPLAKWQTEEYNTLSKDPELLQLYNFITKINDKAKDVGYLQNKGASTFLPFVRKSFAESLAWDMSLSAVKNWGGSLNGRADDVGYGSVNEFTGELENSIPKYYTYDFTKTETGTDFTDVSQDLFKNIILYVNHMEKYKALSDVEGQLLLVKTIETFKGHLDTSRDGNIIFEEGQAKAKVFKGNEKNAKIFDDFLRAILYEQKYPLSDSDMALGIGKVMNYMKMAVNNVAGSEVFTIEDNPTAISLMKTMDAANRWFQVKTLGLEFISGAVNIFGGNIQVATQAGNYFKVGEFMANESKLIGNSFSHTNEREMFLQLVDKFMPLKDDPTYEKLKEAGMTTLTKYNFSDLLMIFMRNPEEHLEKSVFLTLLQNTMIENGKIISIREFVKSKYGNRFDSAESYREVKSKIEEEIEELKKTRSIDAIKKLEDGKLVIPGLDLNNINEIQRLTNLTRRISRNATGALSNSDLNRMGMNIWTKSMMVFKNWIPKLVDTRFSEFRRVSDDFSVTIDENGLTTGEKYDIGRIRLWGYVIGTSLKDKTSNLYNIIALNDKGLEALDRMYEDFSNKYKLQTGEDMNMTREDFIDMIRTNLQNQVKELTMLLSLFGAMLAMGFMVPDEEDDKASKNFYRYSQRVVDKFITELSFFYNPMEFQRMLSGSAFPAMGIFIDVEKFINHFFMETTGLDLSNTKLTPEEVFKKAQPIKYASKMFPVTKSVITYMSLFDSEFAKEYNITVQKNLNR